MGDTKRWIVTYTRHVKQKRKVYQDGILEIHGLSDKVMLYDDCGKLIDSRSLKKDEVVESGESLTFNTHLVDIGDPEKNYKPIKDESVRESDNKSIEKNGIHVCSARHSSFGESKRSGLLKNGAPHNHPNIIQNTSREYRKSELLNFREPSNHQNGKQITVRGWHALYTTQVTQKAKKYHDGFLRLAVRGSHDKQVMLYDDCEKLLDSRFLKKDEVVESGQSLAFDTHLVDIGDLKRNYKPLTDSIVQERNKKSIESARIQQLSDRQNSSDEWHALYTTQLTQKHKTYHDGIVRLVGCGSHGKQIMLLSEDGTILSSKNLKSFECLKNGSTYELANYLVEIGEQRNSQGGMIQKDLSSVEIVSLHSSSSTVDIDNFTSGRRVPKSKPLRDACQILSSLKNPMPWESLAPQKLSVETHPSKSPHLLQLDHQGKQQGQDVQGTKFSDRNVEENNEIDPQQHNRGISTQISTLGSDLSQVKAAQKVPSLGFNKLTDHNSEGKLPPDNSSSNVFSGAVASNITTHKSDVEDTAKSIRDQEASIMRPQVSDTTTCDLPESSEHIQVHHTHPASTSSSVNCGISTIAAPVNSLNGNIEVGKSLEFSYSEGKGSNSNEVEIPEHVKDENSNQLFAATPDACSLGSLSSSSQPALQATNEQTEHCEVNILSKKSMSSDIFPSFDLGF